MFGVWCKPSKNGRFESTSVILQNWYVAHSLIPFPFGSKHQLQRHLDLSRIRSCPADLAEFRPGDCVRWQPKIDDVEKLCPELEIHALCASAEISARIARAVDRSGEAICSGRSVPFDLAPVCWTPEYTMNGKPLLSVEMLSICQPRVNFVPSGRSHGRRSACKS
jgi:hypothetical protein